MSISHGMLGGNETQRALKPVGRVGHQMTAAANATQTRKRSTVFMHGAFPFRTVVPHIIPGLFPKPSEIQETANPSAFLP
jgi:hypothetical protein